jgi:hypothetical protein
MEDLVHYLKGVVEPTVEEFRKNPSSVRHGFLACVAAFHAIDYLAYPQSSRGLRQKYRRASPEFALVDEIAHAFKHVESSLKGLKANEVVSRSPGLLGNMVFNEYAINDTDQRVTLKRNRNLNLLKVVQTAVEFLWKQTEGNQT